MHAQRCENINELLYAHFFSDSTLDNLSVLIGKKSTKPQLSKFDDQEVTENVGCAHTLMNPFNRKFIEKL